MNACIYAIQRKGSDECYIGSAVDVAGRWSAHKCALRNGKHHSSRLQRVHDKHGMDAFEFVILEPVADKARLIGREQVWLDRFSPAYNSATVAGSLLGVKHSDEARAKMSEAAKARPPFSAKHRANMSAAQKGRTHSAETRRRLSAAWKSRPPSPPRSAESRQRTAEANRARPPFSAEHRANISAAAKARPPISDETRRKISAAQRVRRASEASTQSGQIDHTGVKQQ